MPSDLNDLFHSWPNSFADPHINEIPPTEALAKVQTCKGSDYEFIKELGKGAFGAVWLIYHKHLREYFALKILSKQIEIEGLRTFKQCVRNQPLFVGIEEVTCCEGVYCYTMQLADDVRRPQFSPDSYEPKTLDAHLRNKVQLHPTEVFAITKDLLRAVDFLHSKGLVHCDIKPDNIIMVGGQWQVADVGLTTVMSKPLPVGAFGFNAHGVENHQRDLYAVAITMFVLMTGTDRMKIVREFRSFREAMPDNVSHQRELYAALRKIILAACADHYRHANEMLYEIEDAAAAYDTTADLYLRVVRHRIEAATRDIKVQPNRPVFDIGDYIRIWSRVNRKCYLYIVNVGSSGKVTTLLPNEACANVRVPADDWQSFPPNEGGYTLQLDGPPGLGRVHAIATTHKISLREEDLLQLSTLSPGSRVPKQTESDHPARILATASVAFEVMDNGTY